MFSFGATNANAGSGGTGAGLFGNKPTSNAAFSFGQGANAAPQQQQLGGGFAFGGNKQQTNNVGTNSSLFGSSQQSNLAPSATFGNKPTIGGLANNNGTSNLFGNTGTTNSGTTVGNTGLFGQQQQQQQQPNGSGNMFNNSRPAASGGLFGNKNRNTQGTSNTSGGLFGNTTQNFQGTSGAGGGLFGNVNQNTQNGSNMSGGLFGNKTTGTTNNTTGGLFGSKPAAIGSGGGLFGNQQGVNSNDNGGLFGSKSQNTGQNLGGMSFGGGNTGLFTQASQQQQQPQQTSFNVNSLNSTQPSFAWSQKQPNQTMFQQQQQQQQQQQYSQQMQQMQIQQHQNSNYAQQIQEQVVKCKESWDPTSNKTKLRAFVYNKVNETDAILYNKPANINQEEWDHALDKKPSVNVVPAPIFGFDGLNQRSQLQRETVAQARLILNQILEKSTQLQQKHELDTAARIMKAQSRNIQIEKRILQLGTQIAVLKSRGLPLSVNEEKMWSQFQSLLQRSNDPAGLGKTNELWARLAVLKERAKNISDQLDSTLVVISENGTSFSTSSSNEKDQDISTKRTDEEVEKRIGKIAEVLSNQQRGISYLNDVLEKDHRAVEKALKK